MSQQGVGQDAINPNTNEYNDSTAQYLGTNINEKDQDGQTALHRAANASTAKYLIDNKAQVNEIDNKGQTPLYYAIEKGDDEFVKTLIESGANIQHKDVQGQTPILYALKFNNLNIIKYLASRSTPEEINECDENGNSTLHNAVLSNNHEFVKMLCELGANVNAENKDGLTPIHLALYSSTNSMNYLMKRSDVDLHTTDNDGNSLLHTAIKRNIALPESLIKKLDLNHKNSAGESPIHLAIEKGSRPIMHALITNGAELNIVNNNSDTPLLLAVKKGHADIVSTLLKQQKDKQDKIGIEENPLEIDAKDNNGNTALHIAASKKDIGSYRALINTRANYNITNNSNATPLDLALEGKKHDFKNAQYLAHDNAVNGNVLGIDKAIKHSKANTTLKGLLEDLSKTTLKHRRATYNAFKIGTSLEKMLAQNIKNHDALKKFHNKSSSNKLNLEQGLTNEDVSQITSILTNADKNEGGISGFLNKLDSLATSVKKSMTSLGKSRQVER